MVNEDNQVNDKITLDIARQLALQGNYDEAIDLLSPLVHSQFSIEVNNLLAKIYAQKQDFDKASEYFNNVLEEDENNVEAKTGLNKCNELKKSDIKTFFSFNKLKVYSIIGIVLLLLAVIGFASFASLSSNSVYSEGRVFADADAVNLTLKVDRNYDVVLSNLKLLDSKQVKLDSSGNIIKISTDAKEINEVLYVLSYFSNDVDITNASMYLSEAKLNSAYAEANNAAVENANLSNSHVKEIQNISQEMISNTFSFENIDNFNSQQQLIYSMLNSDNFMKVRVDSVVNIYN